MIDSEKLDAFFEGNRSLGFERPTKHKRSIDWRRLLKILFPCLAACLFGLMVVMPNIKKSVDLSDNITLPRKGEMEKLHIEQTVFNTTDSKNRVNKILADIVDEIKPGSQTYRITEPKAIIPTDHGQADITADVGYFNQKTNTLRLEKNVKAVVDNDTVITTSSAVYDFKKERGFGKEVVHAKGSWGTMRAEAFHYDKIKQILVLEGKNVIKTPRGILKADKESRIYQQQNKSISVGNAVIIQNENRLSAEQVVGWFSKNSKKELERAEAYRKVRITTPNEVITGGEAYYDALSGKIRIYGFSRARKMPGKYVYILQGDSKLKAHEVVAYISKDGKNELQKVIATGGVTVRTAEESIIGEKGIYEPQSGKIEMFGSRHPVVVKKEDKRLRAQKIEAYLDEGKDLKYAIATGDVEVVTPKGSAWGDRGIYNPREQKVELFENVRLEQNGNFITGAYAQTDLNTSISRITGDETTGGRIRGTFYKKRKK